MSNTLVTKAIMLDETGQAIVEAINKLSKSVSGQKTKVIDKLYEASTGAGAPLTTDITYLSGRLLSDYDLISVCLSDPTTFTQGTLTQVDAFNPTSLIVDDAPINAPVGFTTANDGVCYVHFKDDCFRVVSQSGSTDEEPSVYSIYGIKVGGSTIEITPSLGSGTKVADYEIDGVAGAIYVPTAPTALSQLSDDSTHRVVTDTEKSTWSGKQDALTFDNAPTSGSSNPVKSSGIYTALGTKANTSDLENLESDLNAIQETIYPDNIFDKSKMTQDNYWWYKASPVGKTFTAPSAANAYSALTIPITGYGQTITSVTLKQLKDAQTVNIFSWYAVDKNMVALSSYENLSPTQSIADGYTISNIAEGTAYLLISLIYSAQAESEGHHLMVSIGDEAEDYSAYFEPYTQAKSLTAEKALQATETLETNKRSVMYIKKEDDDTNLLLKMLEAYNKGNVDVYFEKSTYHLQEAYLYMWNTLVWRWSNALPCGRGCRYFFNDSTIISNAPNNPPEGSNAERNILDCRNKDNDFEIHDVILINNGGRYCVHDEGNNKTTPYTHKYENVTMIYNVTELTPDSGSKPFGCGTGFDASLIFDGCSFIENTANRTRFAIHGPTTNPSHLTSNLHLIMKNCYFDEGTIYVTDQTFETGSSLDFYLFGNKFTRAFVDSNVNIIENNNTVS